MICPLCSSTVNDAAPSTVTEVNQVVDQLIYLRNRKKEYLVCLMLNSQQQIIARETVSIGTLTASLAHPREIFTEAVKHSAAAIILAHNHPSGNPSPSEQDISLTKRIAEAGRIMGIDLLDHVIIAKNGAYSFKTAGLL